MARADEVKGVVGENIKKAKDWLPTGRVLVTVKTDVPLPFEMESLLDKGPDIAKLSKLYEGFGFRTLRDQLSKESAGTGSSIAPQDKPAPKAKGGDRNFAFLARPRRWPMPQPSSPRASTRSCWTRPRSIAGWRSSRPPRSRAWTRRPPISIPCWRSWSAFPSARRQARAPTCLSPIAMPERPRSCPSTSCSAS